MALRTVELNGWLKAINECKNCPHKNIKNNDASFPICGHPNIRQTEHEFTTRLQYGWIPIWCPLPKPASITEWLQNGQEERMSSIFKEPQEYIDEYMAEFAKETNKIVRKFLEKLRKDREGLIRDKLIELGWTPPEKSNPCPFCRKDPKTKNCDHCGAEI